MENTNPQKMSLLPPFPSCFWLTLGDVATLLQLSLNSCLTMRTWLRKWSPWSYFWSFSISRKNFTGFCQPCLPWRLDFSWTGKKSGFSISRGNYPNVIFDLCWTECRMDFCKYSYCYSWNTRFEEQGFLWVVGGFFCPSFPFPVSTEYKGDIAHNQDIYHQWLEK